MTHSAFFLRARTISFSCIVFLSFLWIILISLCLFSQWDVMDHIERSLILIMLFINTITVILIPILLLQTFRPWLDAARLFFLMVSHCGVAIFFAVKSSSFQCVSSVADQEAICGLIILYISVTSWFIPVLVIGYACGLAFLVHRLTKVQTVTTDVEKQEPKICETIPSTPNCDTYHYAI